MKLYVVDAFAEKLFTGNPAGVLPCRQMPPVELMQQIATAFVLHRYADPGVGEMHFSTLSGELIVRAGQDGFTMDFPTGKVRPVPLTPAPIPTSLRSGHPSSARPSSAPGRFPPAAARSGSGWRENGSSSPGRSSPSWWAKSPSISDPAGDCS